MWIFDVVIWFIVYYMIISYDFVLFNKIGGEILFIWFKGFI